VTTVRTRREPPRFRRVEVARVERRGPRLVRVTLTGAELAGLDIGLPAASVRILVPRLPSGEVVLPVWNGNEFLDEEGGRPIIRTLTPLAFDAEQLELDVEIVLHGDGPLSTWGGQARPGDGAAISGTGRGYDIDQAARSFLLAGDESALPAIAMLLDVLPDTADVVAYVEVAEPSGRRELGTRRDLAVTWRDLATAAPPGSAVLTAVTTATFGPDVRVWAAGEAAAMQRLRRHLFDDRWLSRSQAVVRGYWKHGRQGDAVDE
jgi:NADPH-dependent ferric siderophore reductase